MAENVFLCSEQFLEYTEQRDKSQQRAPRYVLFTNDDKYVVLQNVVITSPDVDFGELRGGKMWEFESVYAAGCFFNDLSGEKHTIEEALRFGMYAKFIFEFPRTFWQVEVEHDVD